MKRILGWVILPAAVFLLGGCVSSERMMRFSPLRQDLSRELEADQLNLWPFVFRAGDRLSVLWPLIDVDEHGFAVRPLVHRDGENYGVLWPLSGWDRSGGWIGPVLWGERHFTVLPLLFLGPHLNVCVPAYWAFAGAAGGERSLKRFGFFPLLHRSDRLNWIGPAWWENGGRRGGFFPLAHFSPETRYLFPYFQRGGFHLLGPVWWRRNREGELRSHGFFPLYWNTPTIQIFGPAYRFKPPGVGFGLLPLFVYPKKGGFGSLPVSWQRREGEEGGFKFFNLGLVLFNFHWRYDDRRQYDLLFPLLKFQTGGMAEMREWRIWPLVAVSRSGGLPALLNIKEQGFDLCFSLYRRRHETLPPGSGLTMRTPLETLLREPNRELTAVRDDLLFGLLYRRRQARHQAWLLPPGDRDYQTLVQDLETLKRDFGYAAPNESPAAARTHLLAAVNERLLAWQLAERPIADLAELEAFYRELTGKLAVERSSDHLSLLGGLLYEQVRYGEAYRRRLLGGLLLSTRELEDAEDFRLLGALYRFQRSGRETRRTLFPFITVRSGDDGSSWSFLWRLLERHADADGRSGGHILFIPYGD